MAKLKNSNCDKTKKYKLWQNSKTQIVTILQKTQIVTKLKNSNYDQTQIVAKLKNSNFTKLKKSNCDKTQKHILWQN